MGLITHTPSVGSVKRSRSQIESFRPAMSSMSMLPVLPLLVAATCKLCSCHPDIPVFLYLITPPLGLNLARRAEDLLMMLLHSNGAQYQWERHALQSSRGLSIDT